MNDVRTYNENGTWIEYADDAIYLGDEAGEIVCWHEAEWIENPRVVLAIANAVQTLCESDGDSLREVIQ